MVVDKVIDGVYISGYRATNYVVYLRRIGVTNVLKLYEDIPYFPEDFNSLENAVEDGIPIPPAMLRRGVDFILENVRAGKSVLVMCGAGISRSATFVLAYMLETGHKLPDAYRLLRNAHADTYPHPALWQSLITFYHLDYTMDDVHKWLNEFK